MNRDQVNTRNTPTWVKVNDDAKSSFWRKHFCDLYGGKFTHIDKKWHFIGIRIEDDVLVTKDGHEVLTAGAPKEIDEIESLMAGAR